MKNTPVKRTMLFVRDIFELYIPGAAFLVLFVSFIMQVFTRYVLNSPLTWTNDLIVVGFVWTVLFGASLAMRHRKHVKFTLLYDNLPPKAAALTRLLGNLLIIATFLLLVVPSYKYSQFVKFQKTPVFRINYMWVFLPFVYTVISVIGYTLPEVAEDLRVLAGKLGDSADHAAGGIE